MKKEKYYHKPIVLFTTLDKQDPEYLEFHNVIFNKNVPLIEKKTYLKNMETVTSYSDYLYADRIDGKGFYIAKKDFVLVCYKKNYLYKSNASAVIIVNNGKSKMPTYGKPISKHLFDIAIKYLKIDFIKLNIIDLSELYSGSKLVVDKVISGKVTNINDFNKAFLKHIGIKDTNCLGILNKLYSSSIKDNRNITQMYKNIKKYKCTSINDNSFLMYHIYLKIHAAYQVDNLKEIFPIPIVFQEIYSNQQILDDTIILCYEMQSKMDYGWSFKRILAHHDMLVKEKNKYELKYATNVSFSLHPKIHEHITRYGYEVLSTTEMVLNEGNTMKHCVFSNYISSINSKNYIALHHIQNNHTLGLYVRKAADVNLSFNQLYGYKNERIDESFHIEAHQMISEINEFIKSEGPFFDIDTLFQSFELVSYNKKKLPIKTYLDASEFFGVSTKIEQLSFPDVNMPF